MVKSIEGIYRDGKVELSEPPPAAVQTRVIVTFFSAPSDINLTDRQISPQQAADLRSRLGAFQSDWEAPEMDAYDEL